MKARQLASGIALLFETREPASHSHIRMTMRYTHIGLDDQAKAVAAIPAPRTLQAKASDAPQLWECLRSEPCGEPCHLPSSAGNTVTMELATVNDENPCGDRGLDAVCPSVAIDGTDGKGGGGGNRMSSLILISRNLYWIYTKTQLPRQRMGSAQLAPHVTI
jgi:hypothetical protein